MCLFYLYLANLVKRRCKSNYKLIMIQGDLRYLKELVSNLKAIIVLEAPNVSYLKVFVSEQSCKK